MGLEELGHIPGQAKMTLLKLAESEWIIYNNDVRKEVRKWRRKAIHHADMITWRGSG